jgi:hypothetical protein
MTPPSPDRVLGRREGVRAARRLFRAYLRHEYTWAEARFVLDAWAAGLSVERSAEGLRSYDPGDEIRPSTTVERFLASTQAICNAEGED